VPLCGIEVDADFSAFMKTDVNSSVMFDGFKAALEERGGEKSSRRLESSRGLAANLFSHFDVVLTYEIAEGYQVWDPAVIHGISAFERGMTSEESWKEFCSTVEEDDMSYCTNGISISNYVMPSLEVLDTEIVPSALIFDGLGNDAVPLDTTLRLLKHYDLERIILPLGYDGGDMEEPIVRSVFRFSFLCCKSSDSTSYIRSQVRKFNAVYEKYLKEKLLPFLQQSTSSSRLEDAPFRISYDGTKIKAMEVMQTLYGDVYLAGWSMVFVLLYLICYTRSIFLGITGIILILLAVPFAYVVLAVLSGVTKLSVASFLSLFLVVGLGSDVIFVYSDFWRASAQYHTSISDRFMFTQRCAGKASLATSATTALSFFANLASVLKPLREFGTFMGLCVVTVWLFVTLIFLPLCLVDERVFLLQLAQVYSSRQRIKDDIASVASGQMGAYTSSVEADMPLLLRGARVVGINLCLCICDY
jgi:hypothetical protein